MIHKDTMPLTALSEHNVITGDTNHLITNLEKSFQNSQGIDIIVSFIMESGVRLLLPLLERAVKNKIPIRIITSTYMNITDPNALFLLKDTFGDSIDLRIYKVKNKAFHPKSYIFHGPHSNEVYVGSSNISNGALTDSIEWNYRLMKKNNEIDFNQFCDTFEQLFNHQSIPVNNTMLSEYSAKWKKSSFKGGSIFHDELSSNKVASPVPRGAQIEALYKLKQSRKAGYDKALIVAATGIGKTYLAAFDSKDYSRILFVAHREEILKQASSTFKNVYNTDDIGFFNSTCKDTNCRYTFASIQTLGKPEYLQNSIFDRDFFDYIVIDEFHHAVSKQYINLIQYFRPKFLLGLTATPERLDAQDIYALCDYNTVYEIRLADAINKGWLVPFRYYGIYDETVQYDNITYMNGKYDQKDLEQNLMIHQRAELIYDHYKKYRQKKTLGFCCSKNHAEYMAQYFSAQGVKSISVYSGEQGEYSISRESALHQLKTGAVDIIFSVDMFNEGLDIPEIDMVLFLRPTQSPTIFLQQLGRGLRLFEKKDHLTILDFIGNYKKANLIPFLLSESEYSKLSATRTNIRDIIYPDECYIDFDFRLIDLFEAQSKKHVQLSSVLENEYNQIKAELCSIPTRVELYTLLDSNLKDTLKSKSNLNPFKNYLHFLSNQSDISKPQKDLLGTKAEDFIKMIETTSMSKTYKLPILLAFYNEGNPKKALNENDIYKSFHSFYRIGSNAVDLLQDKHTKEFMNWSKSNYINLARTNPVKYLLKTHEEFFIKGENNSVIELHNDLIPFLDLPEFSLQMKDAIDLRTMDYYQTRNHKIMKKLSDGSS